MTKKKLYYLLSNKFQKWSFLIIATGNRNLRKVNPSIHHVLCLKVEIIMTEKTKIKLDKVRKVEKKKGGVGELTDEEREAVTIVFHQFETGLREGTIFTKVRN